MSDAPPPAAPAPAPSRYGLGSVPNMIRSLVVVGAIMALLLLMVPRVNTVSQPPVDVTGNARSVVESSGLPIEVAKGLPAGWVPTSVRWVRGTDGLQTWHVGYQSPAGTYVAVEQTKGATEAWVRAQVNRAPETGRRTVAGRTWVEHVREDKVQNSLVEQATSPDGLTTVVTGTGSFDELVLVVEHLVRAEG